MQSAPFENQALSSQINYKHLDPVWPNQAIKKNM